MWSVIDEFYDIMIRNWNGKDFHSKIKTFLVSFHLVLFSQHTEKTCVRQKTKPSRLYSMKNRNLINFFSQKKWKILLTRFFAAYFFNQSKTIWNAVTLNVNYTNEIDGWLSDDFLKSKHLSNNHFGIFFKFIIINIYTAGD